MYNVYCMINKKYIYDCIMSQKHWYESIQLFNSITWFYHAILEIVCICEPMSTYIWQIIYSTSASMIFIRSQSLAKMYFFLFETQSICCWTDWYT